MNDEIILSSDDVVSVEQDSISSSQTSTIRELMQRLGRMIYEACDGKRTGGWTENGVSCKFLSSQGGGWQKGKIRIRFEFIPDNPTAIKLLTPSNSTSPLDDLRSQLNPE